MTHERPNPHEKLLHQRIRTKEDGEAIQDIAYYEINRMSRELGIEETVSQVARAIYRRSLETQIIQNRSLANIVTAALYAACRIEGLAYSQRDVYRISPSPRIGFERTFAELTRELDLRAGPVDPELFVSRYREQLGLSDRVEEKAIELIEVIKDEEPEALSGRSPAAFSASAIYCAALLCDERITQREVSDVVGINVSTIRTNYQYQIQIVGNANNS